MKALIVLFLLVSNVSGFSQTDVQVKQPSGKLLKLTYTRNSLLPPPDFGLRSSPNFRYSFHSPELYIHFYLNEKIGFRYHSNSHVKDPYRKNRDHVIGNKIIHHGSTSLYYEQLEYEHVKLSKVDMECLIVDSLKKLSWQFYDQTKTIHNKTCYLAIHVTEKSDTVLAWFTTKLPFKNNMRDYHGLPGLALEIYDQRINMHYLVKKIEEVDGTLMLPEKCRILSMAAYRKEIDQKSSRLLDR